MVFDESMKRYIMLLQEDKIMVQEEPEFEELQVDEMLDQHELQEIFEDLGNLKSKLENFQCIEGDQSYAEGFEAGMFEAANLLISLLETKYGKRL